MYYNILWQLSIYNYVIVSLSNFVLLHHPNRNVLFLDISIKCAFDVVTWHTIHIFNNFPKLVSLNFFSI